MTCRISQQIVAALHSGDTQITINNRVYQKDLYVQRFLEKLFDSSFEAVFIDTPPQITKASLNVGSHTIIILKKCGRTVMLTNSEWGSFKYLK